MATESREDFTEALFASVNHPSVNLVLEPDKALMAIAILAVMADGELSEVEKPTLKANCTRIFGTKSAENFQIIEKEVWELVGQYNYATVFASAKQALTPLLRETAFAIAAELVLADGIFTQEERRFLVDLWNALDISDDMGQKIIDVMIIKNCRFQPDDNS